MSTHDDDDDYEVGYGRPPRHSRFRAGQSGNPKGRPKGSKNVGTMLEEVFFRKIVITENGVRRQVTVLEAIMKQMVAGALKGEGRSLDRVLKLLPVLRDLRDGVPEDGGSTGARDPQSDRAVLEALADIVGTNPDEFLASIGGGIGDGRSIH
jgi:hypothetical protein